MKKTPLQIVGAVCAAGMAVGAVSFSATALQAGITKDTAFVTVTIQAAASFGAVTTTPVATTSTSTSIRTVPVSTTSNVGYSDPAPVTGGAAVAPTGSSGTTTTPAQAARAFAARGASPISFGGASSFAVSGSPNQTFTVILPGQTSFTEGGNIVSLTGFQHSAGPTPTLGADGSGSFSVGAAVSSGSTASDGSGADSDAADQEAGGASDSTASSPPTVLAQAFTQQAPLVNLVLVFN